MGPRVFTHESLIVVSHIRNILEHAGIASVIKNERLSGALGEIPYLETWPELHVVDSADAERARLLIAAAMQDTPTSAAWTCTRCGEQNEGHFAVCWHCQTAAPG